MAVLVDVLDAGVVVDDVVVVEAIASIISIIALLLMLLLLLAGHKYAQSTRYLD